MNSSTMQLFNKKSNKFEHAAFIGFRVNRHEIEFAVPESQVKDLENILTQLQKLDIQILGASKVSAYSGASEK